MPQPTDYTTDAWRGNRPHCKAWPIISHSQIFRYAQIISCLPHRAKSSDFLYLWLYWVSLVRISTWLKTQIWVTWVTQFYRKIGSEAGTLFSLLHVTIIICLPLTTEKSESNLGLSNIATVKKPFFFCNHSKVSSIVTLWNYCRPLINDKVITWK